MVRNLTLAAVSVLATLVLAELAFRIAGVDLDRQERAFRERPIFFRQPTVPVGPVFFRRPGPDRWHGNVLSTQLRLVRHPADDRPDPYADLPPITAVYDGDGFRNPPDLPPWEIVVVGDSFTEAGYLPQAELFSDIAASRLGLTARNLGVSFTGPPAHNFYLTEYGPSPRLRHAVLAFFEGNDLDDLKLERLALVQFRRTGVRTVREIRPETSLLRFLRGRLAAVVIEVRQRRAGRPRGHEAYFESADGAVPVDFRYAPPPAIPPTLRAHLDAELAAWARNARALGATPWLLYLPAKRRVLDGRLRFDAAASEKFSGWIPGRLPEQVAALAAARGIRVVDATPALRAHALAGSLPYNSILDTHLNALGSRAVGEALAAAIGAADSDGPADHELGPFGGVIPSDTETRQIQRRGHRVGTRGASRRAGPRGARS